MGQSYPMILPWLAGKAGVRNDKAEALWIEALRDTNDNKGGVPESSEYWEIAVNHLRVSLACIPGVSRARQGAVNDLETLEHIDLPRKNTLVVQQPLDLVPFASAP